MIDHENIPELTHEEVIADLAVDMPDEPSLLNHPELLRQVITNDLYFSVLHNVAFHLDHELRKGRSEREPLMNNAEHRSPEPQNPGTLEPWNAKAMSRSPQTGAGSIHPWRHAQQRHHQPHNKIEWGSKRKSIEGKGRETRPSHSSIPKREKQL